MGNLVALPLQGNARRKGNSVFVDDNFQAYLDQWDVLQNIQRLDIYRLEQILQLHVNSVSLELSHTSEEKPLGYVNAMAWLCPWRVAHGNDGWGGDFVLMEEMVLENLAQ